MPQSETDQAEQKLRQWIEAALGRVVEFGPLPGWRPAWNVSVKTPAGIMGVHIRGDRDAGQEMQPLRREYDVLCLLESEGRSEEHTSELKSIMRNSYAVFCLK